MIQFTDLFIARDDKEARTYDIYSKTSSQDITENELIILWACIEKTVLRHHHELIFVETEKQEILYKLPPMLIKLIANIENSNLSDLIIRWAEHEEIHWTYEKAKEKLNKLMTLSKEAQQKKYDLYLVMI